MRKRVISWVFRYSPLKNTKNRISAKNSGEYIFDPFLVFKTDPVFLFWAPFSVSWPQKSGHCRAKFRDEFRKVRFLRISLLPGSILEPPGTISEPPGLDFGASGPCFGAILHKPGEKAPNVRIPKNGRDFPCFFKKIRPFSEL